jgi:signal peptidase II
MAHLRAEDDRRIRGDEVVKAGDVIRVTYRDVTIIDGYWDFQYARNPGAAFSFLADADPSVRRPFFIAISVLALLAILYILSGVQLHQQLLIWGLSLIASGAVGNNLIDRVRFGYVVDFILWKYTDAYRWPVFNIADVLICVGVGLMVIDMIRDTLRQRAQYRAASDVSEDVASSEQAANSSA